MSQSVWVAVAPIVFGVTRAFNPGDIVPDSNVSLWKYDTQGLVVRRTIPDDPTQAVNGVDPLTQAEFDALTTGAGRLSDAGLKASFVPALPSAGAYTYNADGTIASDPDGNSYTWNADGTPKTQTKGGVTRTFNWNADGTLASVS